MMLLPCPWCGPRNVSEFRYVGEARPRPDPNTTTPAAWRSYLYSHDNPCGAVVENWYHRNGCRRYFSTRRDTLSNDVEATGYRDPSPLRGSEARSEQPTTRAEPGAGGGPV